MSNRRAMQWIAVLIVGIVAGSIFTYWVMSRSEKTVEEASSPSVSQPSQPSVETDPEVITAPAEMDPNAPTDTPRYELHDAASKGLIRYEASGTGASSGASMLVAIQRITDDDIDVYVVPGTVFQPSNGGVQKMVAWGVVGTMVDEKGPMQPVTSMYLVDLKPHAFVLEAYCLNFDLNNPSFNDRFQPAVASELSSPQAIDIRSAQIIYEGKRRDLSAGGIQTAIWADRDHKTKHEIQTKFDATDEEMDQAFEMLKNMPPPKIK